MFKNEISVTILSKDLQFLGNLETKDDLRIDAEIDGNIVSSGKVFIGKFGKVRGHVYARWIEVNGFCEGELFASEGINLDSRSVLKGNAISKKIFIHEEAIVEGRIDIKKEIIPIDVDRIINNKKDFNINERTVQKVHQNFDPKINHVNDIDSESGNEIYGAGWI